MKCGKSIECNGNKQRMKKNALEPAKNALEKLKKDKPKIEEDYEKKKKDFQEKTAKASRLYTEIPNIEPDLKF